MSTNAARRSARRSKLGRLEHAARDAEMPSDANVVRSPRGHSYVFSAGDQVANINTSAYTRGPFGRLTWRRLAELSDGTSNTIAMSEIVAHLPVGFGGETGATSSGRNKLNSVITNNIPGVVSSPSVCRTVASGEYYVAGKTIHGRRGICWTDGPATLTMFNTVLPPNSPACAIRKLGRPGQYRAPAAELASGRRQRRDVRWRRPLLHQQHQHRQPGRPVNKESPSPYGVWGALGSIAGGDILDFRLRRGVRHESFQPHFHVGHSRGRGTLLAAPRRAAALPPIP